MGRLFHSVNVNGCPSCVRGGGRLHWWWIIGGLGTKPHFILELEFLSQGTMAARFRDDWLMGMRPTSWNWWFVRSYFNTKKKKGREESSGWEKGRTVRIRAESEPNSLIEAWDRLDSQLSLAAEPLPLFCCFVSFLLNSNVKSKFSLIDHIVNTN